jgi:hypothetical protein
MSLRTRETPSAGRREWSAGSICRCISFSRHCLWMILIWMMTG